MAAEASTTSAPDVFGAQPPPQDGLGFIRRYFRLAGPYWSSEDSKLRAWGLTAVLVALTLCQVVVPIQINLWSAALFDALEARSMERFLVQIGLLAVILTASMTVTASHLWVKRRIQLDWRKWVTRQLLAEWMDKGRHFQIAHLPGEHDNPDGRIAEDIRNATESAVDLVHSLVYCLLLLISFTKILWGLSGEIEVEVALFDTSVVIYGHMVWAALVYAALGTSAALLLGRPLVKAANTRQTVEANFRFGLVRARENSEAIALVHGEEDERRRFKSLFRGIEKGWNRQTTALTSIFLFTSGYSVLSTAFPVIVAAPRYIGGAITLGVLMQTAQAFQQMAASLSWPIDNLSKVAEWRASVERVLGLHNSLGDLEHEIAQADERRIVVAPDGSPALTLRDLSVASPDGEVIVSNVNAEIAPGERVLITGDPVAAVKLFKVVAGLWPWGRGSVGLPEAGPIFFMPQRPYLPIGPLRGALSYPEGPDTWQDESYRDTLDRVGLRHLAERLHEHQTWEQQLTMGELQRVGFARLLLHRPRWIFNQEATDSLDPDSEDEMMRLVEAEFPDATILTVGFHVALEPYHQRKLVLVRSLNGLILVREDMRGQDPEPRGGRLGRVFGSLRKMVGR